MRWGELYFFLPSLSVWCRTGVILSPVSSLWCDGFQSAGMVQLESLQGCQHKTWLEQNVSHGHIEPEQIMLLGCGRQF